MALSFSSKILTWFWRCGKHEKQLSEMLSYRYFPESGGTGTAMWVQKEPKAGSQRQVCLLNFESPITSCFSCTLPEYIETQGKEAEIHLAASRREFSTHTAHDIYLNAERLHVLYSDSYLLVTVPAAHTGLKNKHSFLTLWPIPTEKINSIWQTLKGIILQSPEVTELAALWRKRTLKMQGKKPQEPFSKAFTPSQDSAASDSRFLTKHHRTPDKIKG